MNQLGDYTMQLGPHALRPIVIGGMGVDISTSALALEAARLGGVGHISDAMIQHVSDKNHGTRFGQRKQERHLGNVGLADKSTVKFDLEELREAQLNHVRATMGRKRGDGLVFINVMEKLTMAGHKETLRTRLVAALDAGVEGITLSAGLHMDSLAMIADHPRFNDALLGIIVSSARALKIFLRSAGRQRRLPDYIVVEGPLAGGHLGFGHDWAAYDLKTIVVEVLDLLAEQSMSIPVIAAGGIFTGSDAVEMMRLGAAGVQVGTRFTVTEECGLPAEAKQAYFSAREEEVLVTDVSPTGYPLRMLSTSPCLDSNVRPMCETHGYVLDDKGQCAYLDVWHRAAEDPEKQKQAIREKICLCYHFSRYNCYTCGHYAYRLKDTSVREADGRYRLLPAAHVFDDYLTSVDGRIKLPAGAAATPSA